MRQGFHPAVERLESLTMLSGLQTPAFSFLITTDRTSYQVGQPVHMTLTETNTSSRHVKIDDGPGLDGFYVTQNGATVWRSNSGPQPLFLVQYDLAPGQSFTLSATWDGHPTDPDPFRNELPATPTGTFQVHSEVEGTGALDRPATVTIGAPLTVGVTTDRASYRPGQPVRVTLTETNTSDHDVAVLTGGRVVSGSAAGPRGPVWVYHDTRGLATGRGVLHPGQSRQFTILWNGRPDVPGTRVVAGDYTVRAGVDGASGAVVVHIGR